MINFDYEDVIIICILIIFGLFFGFGIYGIFVEYKQNVAICAAHGLTLHQGGYEYFCVDKNGQAFYFQ